jgi:DNA-binding CsgD family transcriptional regulator
MLAGEARDLDPLLADRVLGDAGGNPLAITELARAARNSALLTRQEYEIARLAAEGQSNREIGARLFLSHRTVGYHLYKAYPKLGITSRTQLPGVFARETGANAAPPAARAGEEE